MRAVLPRHGVLRRSDDSGREEILAANVDFALVMTSANRDLNVRRLERFLAIAAGAGAEALLVLSKVDLVADPAPMLAELAAATSREVLPICSITGYNLDALRERLEPGKVTALLGSSGAGKSTLVNALLGEERQFTLPIREADDRGRHATRRRELIELPGGALMLDMPGLRLPRVAQTEGVLEAFAEIEALARRCRFRDCAHENEPGCAVRGTVAPDRLAAMRRLELEARLSEERASRRRPKARR